MLRGLLWWLAALLFSQAAPFYGAKAQNAAAFNLSDRDKATLGIVEVRIFSLLDPTSSGPPERGTGTIVSGEGHVLTAGHLLQGDFGKICRGQADAPPDMGCEIRFYWKGEQGNGFKVTIVSSAVADADYLVLKLPAAADQIQASSWPAAILASRVADNDPLAMAGYTGSEPVQSGAANGIEVASGRVRPGGVAACPTGSGDGWGLAREMSGRSAPGWSGGPVFNQSHRLAGIVLGRGCAGAGSAGGGVFDLDYSRILPIANMTGLCTVGGFNCNFGFAGDIDPPGRDRPASWRERLISGPAAANNFVFGWRFAEWIQVSDIGSACRFLPVDATMMERVESARARGSQAAEYLSFVAQLCRYGLNGFGASAAGQGLRDLADRGYEPALLLQAQVELAPVVARSAPGSNPLPTWNLTIEERQAVKQAQARLSQASQQDWPAAHYLLFEGCRQRLFDCPAVSLAALLDQAARNGHVEALRIESIYLLAGNGDGDRMRSRYGFSLPKDTARGLAQLQQLAQPRAGANEIAWIKLWDPVSSGYLAYFHAGGSYAGQSLVERDQVKYMTYIAQCNSNVPPGTPLFDFCGFILTLSNFNDSTQSEAIRKGAWGILTQFTEFQPLYFRLARNLRSWSQDGSGFDRIDCPLAFDLTFTAPSSPPQPQPRTAYCYFSLTDLAQ